MTRRERYLECVHVLATIDNYGPLPAAELADLANTECDHDAFDSLPEISRRGITAKLNGYSLNGMVRGEWPGGGKPMVWRLTEHGQKVLMVFRSEEPFASSRAFSGTGRES